MTDHNPYQPPKSNVVATSNKVGKKLTIEEALASSYDFDISEVVKDAWTKVTGIKLPFFLGLLTIFAISIITGIIINFLPKGPATALNFIINLFISAMMAGFIALALKRLNGQPIVFKDDFFSISTIFNILVIAAFLTNLFTIIGIILLLIPGIYLSIAYCLTNWIIVDNPGIGAWQAMETSRKIVTKHWFKFFLLMFLLGCICFLSAIPLGIGLFWTFPLMILSIGTVYKKIFYAQ